MARLIDADKLIEDIENSWDWLSINNITASTVLRQTIADIKNEPTVDAVSIIRCRDCKWWTKQDNSLQGRCSLLEMYPTGAWYCANATKEKSNDRCPICGRKTSEGKNGGKICFDCVNIKRGINE